MIREEKKKRISLGKDDAKMTARKSSKLTKRRRFVEACDDEANDEAERRFKFLDHIAGVDPVGRFCQLDIS